MISLALETGNVRNSFHYRANEGHDAASFVTLIALAVLSSGERWPYSPVSVASTYDNELEALLAGLYSTVRVQATADGGVKDHVWYVKYTAYTYKVRAPRYFSLLHNFVKLVIIHNNNMCACNCVLLSVYMYICVYVTAPTLEKLNCRDITYIQILSVSVIKFPALPRVANILR